MSNCTPNPFEPVSEEVTPVCKKNVASRIFAALLVAMSVAVVFLLKVFTIDGNVVGESPFFETVKALFGGTTNTLFGLPALADTVFLLGKCTALALYLLLLCLALSVILGIIAIFWGKKSPALLRTVSFLISFGFLSYAVTAYAWGVIDLFAIAPGAVAALIYTVLAFVRAGKKGVASFFHLILSIAAMGAVLYGLMEYADLSVDGASFVEFDTLAVVIAGVIGFVLITGGLRFQAKKGLVFDMFRYILQIVVGGFALFVAFASDLTDVLFLILAIAATVISLIQLVICILQKRAGKKKVAEETEDAAVPQIAPAPAPCVEEVAPCPACVESGEYVVEEYAEATAYEGGPVEGVEVAQEVNPTFVAPPASVQTAGYDFYNSKSFDPFIAILSAEERNQFTELFILKYKGVMPEIPDYEVGGNNKEFFRKVFIYLGQYRDRIPDSLLAKIYQFAIKMN